MSREQGKKPFYKKWWVWVLAILVIGGIANAGEDTASTTSTTSTDSGVGSDATSNASSEKKETKKQYSIGDEVNVGKLSYIIKDVEEKKSLSSVLGNKTTEGKFVVVELTVKNNDNESRTADTNMFKIMTPDGKEFSADGTLDMYVNKAGDGFFLEQFNPHISRTGKVVFELPAEAEEYSLRVSSGLGWKGGEYEEIKLK
jgi:hypothetical protein